MAKKRKCDFRIPPVMRLDGIPYGERWAIYCSCGTTIFSNTKEGAETSWKRHADGELRD